MFEDFGRPWKFWNIPKFCIAHSHIIYPQLDLSQWSLRGPRKVVLLVFFARSSAAKAGETASNKNRKSSWWCQPISKIFVKIGSTSPIFGVKYKIIIWVATNQKYVWPSEESGFLTTKWRTIQWDVLFTSQRYFIVLHFSTVSTLATSGFTILVFIHQNSNGGRPVNA